MTLAPSDETTAPPRMSAPRRSGLRARAGGIDPWLVGSLVLVALFLLPTLRDGYRGDDTFTSEVRGQLAFTGQSVPHFLWDQIVNFWHSGRPQPLGIAQGLLTSWTLNDHPTLYHLWLLILIVVAAWAFYALLTELGLRRSVAALAVVVVAGTLQLRSYHDPVLGYWGTMEIILALTFASLRLFLRGLRTRERRLLVWSFLLFLPCPMLYEGAYPLVALYPVVALFERRGLSAWRAAAPFLILGVVFVGLSLGLRATTTTTPPGYEVSGSLWGALRTFLIQLFAPIPGSSLMFRADFATFIPLGSSPTKAELLAGAWRGAAVFAVVLVVGLRLARRGDAGLPSPALLGRMAIIGGVLWVASVTLISMAPKYQLELVPGKGHLPTFNQTFGWALVMCASLLALARVALRRSTLALRLLVLCAAALLGFGAAVDGYNNTRVVALEVPIRQSRDLLENAAARGAFATMPPGATLLFSAHDLRWATGYFAQLPENLQYVLIDRTGRRYDSRILDDQTQFCRPSAQPNPPCLAPVQNPTAWVRTLSRRGSGAVIVARIDHPSAAKLNHQTTRDIRVYRTGSGASQPPQLTALTQRGRLWRSTGLAWRRVASGGDWAIYETHVTARQAPVAFMTDDVQPQVDFMAPGTPDQIVRTYGTKRLLP